MPLKKYKSLLIATKFFLWNDISLNLKIMQFKKRRKQRIANEEKNSKLSIST